MEFKKSVESAAAPIFWTGRRLRQRIPQLKDSAQETFRQLHGLPGLSMTPKKELQQARCLLSDLLSHVYKRRSRHGAGYFSRNRRSSGCLVSSTLYTKLDESMSVGLSYQDFLLPQSNKLPKSQSPDPHIQ